VYRLPDEVAAKVEAQYARDVARMAGGAGGPSAEEEYGAFLAELGGTDPRAGAPPGGAGPGRGQQEPEACKLWVGNLPSSVDDNGLRALFSPYGMVTLAAIKTEGPGGPSRGFGFIHFSEESAARAAQQALQGHMVEGRAISVRVKSDPQERGGGGRAGLGAGFGGSGGGGVGGWAGTA
jgi:hypothetical protein